jgi:hypothetical protein
MARDLVTDLAKAAKVFQRLAEGDITVADVLLGRNPTQFNESVDAAPVVSEGEAKCDKTPGCICAPSHNGGCVLDAEVG